MRTIRGTPINLLSPARTSSSNKLNGLEAVWLIIDRPTDRWPVTPARASTDWWIMGLYVCFLLRKGLPMHWLLSFHRCIRATHLSLSRSDRRTRAGLLTLTMKQRRLTKRERYLHFQCICGWGMLGSDLPIDIDKQLIWMESRHNSIRLLNEYVTKPRNRSTTSPLVINRAETWLTSPRRLIPACESKNTSKNKIDCNQIAYEWLSTRIWGSTNRSSGETVLDRLI